MEYSFHDSEVKFDSYSDWTHDSFIQPMTHFSNLWLIYPMHWFIEYWSQDSQDIFNEHGVEWWIVAQWDKIIKPVGIRLCSFAVEDGNWREPSQQEHIIQLECDPNFWCVEKAHWSYMEVHSCGDVQFSLQQPSAHKTNLLHDHPPFAMPMVWHYQKNTHSKEIIELIIYSGLGSHWVWRLVLLHSPPNKSSGLHQGKGLGIKVDEECRELGLQSSQWPRYALNCTLAQACC